MAIYFAKDFISQLSFTYLARDVLLCLEACTIIGLLGFGRGASARRLIDILLDFV